jgi:hypothetical protein
VVANLWQRNQCINIGSHALSKEQEKYVTDLGVEPEPAPFPKHSADLAALARWPHTRLHEYGAIISQWRTRSHYTMLYGEQSRMWRRNQIATA